MTVRVAAVSARAHGGPLRIRVTTPHSPHALTGVIWRYDAERQPISDTPVGEFSPSITTVPIGSPSSLNGNFFLVEGAVLHMNDNPPVQYQVSVAILQGESVIHEEVPHEGGAGDISGEDKAFVYRFQLTEAP